jgi:hypothetical protein
VLPCTGISTGIRTEGNQPSFLALLLACFGWLLLCSFLILSLILSLAFIKHRIG